MPDILEGRTFSRFHLRSRLGKGGMASVYCAHEPTLDRTIALKVLPEELLSQSGFVERFNREARVVANLEHPSIVPLYSHGIDEGRPWMALRLVRGGHLGDRIKNGDLATAAGLGYFVQIASAIDFAHSQGVIHRDLKPENILMGEHGECYVADFGIASVLESTTRLTQTGGVIGTVQYMAPEQAKGERVGAAADIYALGVIVYEWLAGEPPFRGNSLHAVMFKQINEPVPVHALNHLPDPVQRAIVRALAKNPLERWATATQFVTALQESLTDAGTNAPSGGGGVFRRIFSIFIGPPKAKTGTPSARAEAEATVAMYHAKNQEKERSKSLKKIVYPESFDEDIKRSVPTRVTFSVDGEPFTLRLTPLRDRTPEHVSMGGNRPARAFARVEGIQDQTKPVRIDRLKYIIQRAARDGRIVGV